MLNRSRTCLLALTFTLASGTTGCQALVDDLLGTVTVQGRVGTNKGEPIAGATVSAYAITDLALESAVGDCRFRAADYDAARRYPGCPILLIGDDAATSTYRLQPAEFPEPIGRAQTGADGSYSIPGVSRNGYIVLSRKSDYGDGLAGMNARTGQITAESAVVPETAEAETVEVNLVMAGGTVDADGRTEDAGDAEEPALPEPGARSDECQLPADCDELLGPAPAGFVWLCEPGTDGARICTGVAATDEGCGSDADCDDADPATSDFCLADGTCGHCHATEPDGEELPPVAQTEWLSFRAYDFAETELADATAADVPLDLDASPTARADRVILLRGQISGGADRAFLRIQTGASSCSDQEPTTELMAVQLDAAGNVVSEKGDFQAVPLTGGYQVLQLASSDGADALVSHRITIGTRCQLQPFELQVIMSWDTDGDDVDLHTWNSAGEETAYTNLDSDYGFLDLDDTYGFGPEVFTAKEGHTGDSYSVRLHYYRGPNRPNATVRVIQTDGSCLRDETFVVTFQEARQWIDVGNFTPSRACEGR